MSERGGGPDSEGVMGGDLESAGAVEWDENSFLNWNYLCIPFILLSPTPIVFIDFFFSTNGSAAVLF